jgi:acyl carrier protein
MQVNQANLFEKITNVLVDHFEIERNKIKPEARLQEDLDLDSIDGIELILKLEEQYNEKIPAERLKKAKTVQDVLEALKEKMQTENESNSNSS